MLGSPGRLVASVDLAMGMFELDGHGFEEFDKLVFRAASGGMLPTPIQSGRVYYALRISESRFQVAASASAVALTFSGTAKLVSVATELPFEDVFDFYSRFVDSAAASHSTPFAEPYPTIITATVAELSARKLQLLAGHTSEAVKEYEIQARALIREWSKGAAPVRDTTKSDSTNLSIVAKRSE
jgi:hypothetical protein